MRVDDPRDFVRQIREAASVVDRWISRVGGADGWLRPDDATWSNKDLLGHLTAWSDLLIDEVEALLKGRLDAIPKIDVDAWNARQVAERRDRSSETMVDDWRRSARRAADVAERLPASVWSSTWRVAWADRPVAVGDLLRLWLVHIEQHRARLVV